MRRNRKVKILATVGPASSEEPMLRKLFEAGADVFRINMSHSSHDLMRELVKRIRNVELAVKRPIGILCDLQGPKLRVGKFENVKVELTPGQTFTLDDNPAPGNKERVFLPHPEILQSVQPGHRLLIDDGKLALVAEASDGKSIRCKVISGTVISDKKGVSLPDTTLPVGALTEKDRADLDACIVEDIDWIALSFVQRPEDVAEVKKIAAGRAAVMSKLEKPQAIERLAEIIEISDALMVARGDLGVEMPLEAVPGIQKQITRAARARRQAGGRCHADAGIDDHRRRADPRRSLGCGHRRVRRRGRRHAVGRIRLWRLSGRSGGHHGADCAKMSSATRSIPASSTRSAPSPMQPPLTASRSPRARSPKR